MSDDLGDWTDEELLILARAVIKVIAEGKRAARATPPLLTDPERLNTKVAELNDVPEEGT